MPARHGSAALSICHRARHLGDETLILRLQLEESWRREQMPAKQIVEPRARSTRVAAPAASALSGPSIAMLAAVCLQTILALLLRQAMRGKA